MRAGAHIALVGLAIVAVAGGCSSGDGQTADATTTTASPAATTTTAGPDAEGSFAVLAGEGVAVDLDALAGNLQDRLIAAGYDEGVAVVAGDRVEVSPGDGPLDEATLDDLLTSPGRLEFRPVLEVLPPDCEVGTPTGADEVAVYPELDDESAVTACYSLAPSGITNDAVEDASATYPANVWVVNPIFTEAGIDAFNALAVECAGTTDACPTGMVAIAVDGVVLSAPTVNEPVFQRDQIQISGDTSGDFTQGEARALAAAIRVEPLPSGLEVVR